MNIIVKKLIDLLIQLAKADNHYAKEEMMLVKKIAIKYNISKEELAHITENPNPIGSLGALSPERKFEYLYTMIQLMKVDGRILKSEILFCQDAAIKLGFRIEVVEALTPLIDEEFEDDSRLESLKETAFHYL